MPVISNRTQRRLSRTVRFCRAPLYGALCNLLACAEPAPMGDEPAIASSRAALLDVAPVTAPFSYSGTSAGANCGSASYSVVGHQPTSAGSFPLFLYFVGTDDPHDQQAARILTEAVAQRGYVALSVGYDNAGWWNLSVDKILAKATCLYAPNVATSLVRLACQGKADCNQGIVTWGHSQGAVIAALGASYDARVRATWATGFGELGNSRAWAITLMLEPKRLRLVNGEDDGAAAQPEVLNEITRRSCQRTDTNVSTNCFATALGDQGGWFIIDNNDLADNPADHCWFYKTGCSTAHIEPNWQNGSFPFSLGPSVAWLERARRLGEIGANRELAFHFKGLQDVDLAEDALIGQYPAGTVDWGAATVPPGLEHFHVAIDEEPSHAYLGDFWETLPTTGQFTLWGRQGRTMKSALVKNTADTSCTLTSRITLANGNVLPVWSQEIPAGSTVRFYFAPNEAPVPNAKLVRLTSSVGARLQFHEFVVSGRAEVAVPL